MTDLSERLKKARIHAKFRSARQAAIKHGWRYSTYAAHENGQNDYGPDEAKQYGKAFKVNSAWLLTGEGQMALKPNTASAVGYVGGGAEVFPIDDYPVGDGMEEIEIPPGVPVNAVLVIVRGDSMRPRYFDGEYLFYLRDQRPPSELVGRECVVKLQDGRAFVKVLRNGSRKGRFNLESWNADLIEDQAVEWAAPVIARVNRGTK